MKVLLVSAVLALLATTVIADKKCYLCYKIERNGTHLEGDKSCVSSGDKPDDSLVENCNLTRSASSTFSVSPTILPKMASVIADLEKSANVAGVSPKKKEEGCFKIIHEGQVTGQNGNFKMTNRGCIVADPFPDKKCQTKSLSEWAKATSDFWSLAVVALGDATGFQRNGQATACVCTKDKCNSSGRAASSWALSLVLAGVACSGILKGLL